MLVHVVLVLVHEMLSVDYVEIPVHRITVFPYTRLIHRYTVYAYSYM